MRSGIFNLLMLSDNYGLNKLARLRREREQAAEDVVLPLDAEFPYDVLGFDDKFFMAEPSDYVEPEG